MGEFGQLLKETRESKDISLAQIDQDIKIKAKFIEALENEDFASFPSVPMLRGFIKNYATYLDLDPAHLMALYEANAPDKKHKLVKEITVGHGIQFMDLSMVKRRSLINFESFLVLLLIAGVLGVLSFFLYTQYFSNFNAQADEMAPVEYQTAEPDSEQAILLPTPTAPPTETPTPTPTPSPQYYTGVAVELNVLDRSWVQILVDDEIRFEGNLEAGDSPNWVGEKRVGIRAGNGGGIEVIVNGQNMGLMGEPGQVIDQVWEKVEEAPADSPETETPTPEPESQP